MRPLMTLILTFCLVYTILAKPIPDGEVERSDGAEEPVKDDDAGQTTETSEDLNSSTENGEETGDDTNKKKDEEEDQTEDKVNKKEDEGASSNSKNEEGEVKNNPIETYNKVIELLDKTTKTDMIDSSYLRSSLVGDLQTYLRNPVVDIIGRVGDFSKISDCFKSMGENIKKILDDILKSFKSCKDKKDSNEHQCASDRSSAQDQIAKISSTISSCVASKRA